MYLPVAGVAADVADVAAVVAAVRVAYSVAFVAVDAAGEVSAVLGENSAAAVVGTVPDWDTVVVGKRTVVARRGTGLDLEKRKA